MPLYVFYTMVQKSQKWPKTQIKGGGGPALTPPKIEEKAISVVKQHKHLGVVLSDDLSWSAHITHVLAQGKCKAGFLRYMAKELPADLVSKIYITYVRPTLEYASPVWHGDLSKQQSLALERVQASVARRIKSTMDNTKERTFRATPMAVPLLATVHCNDLSATSTVAKLDRPS